MPTSESKQFFTATLMHWHKHFNHRSLPWKEEKDAYKIWLSEIILQQTRAEQGAPYYYRFLENYPTVDALATAKDEAVFLLWQGLGYYNRCKNLLATARHIHHEKNGKFPAQYTELLSLKGIGPYTAAAIASFAFNAPNAVLDGNVVRVLARFFGIETAIDSKEGKQIFPVLADELLDRENSAQYNQAIMDFGATVCTPALPECNSCPLQKECFAFQKNLVASLPIKTKKVAVRKRYFHYLLLERNDEIWISKRTGKDIWQSLHELFLIENVAPLNEQSLLKNEHFQKAGISTKPLLISVSKQKLTHQLIEARFFQVSAENASMPLPENGFWIKKSSWKNYAFPKTLVQFFKEHIH